MHSLGIILTVLGLLLCASIIGLPIGLPMFAVGMRLIQNHNKGQGGIWVRGVSK